MAEDETAQKAPAINWVQVSAGSLAAVSSAVLLSTLGVAGTLIGAALGSVIASVASSLYSRGISVSSQQVRSQASVLRRVTTARSQLDQAVSAMDRGETGAQARVAVAGQQLSEAERALQQAEGSTPEAREPVETSPAPRSGGWRERLAGLPWKRVLLISAGLFVVTMVAITVFELSTGRPVSTYTGGSDRDSGTTVPGLRDSGPATPEPTGEPTDDPSATPTGSATDEPDDSPTVEPSEAPSDTSTPAPTEAPTPQPTAPPANESTPGALPTPQVGAEAPPVEQVDPEAPAERAAGPTSG